MNQIKGILFDMDGTVLASEGLFDKAIKIFLEEKNIIIKSQELNIFKGLSYKDFYPKFTKKFKIRDEVELIRKRIRTNLYKLMETDLKYINGFKSFHKDIIKYSDIKTAVVTNTTRKSYEKIQSIVNINKYFNYSITVTEAKKPKPSPEPYLQAMERLNLIPTNTIIIEDSKTGFLSALKTKSKVVGITTTLRGQEIKNISKDIQIAKSYLEIKNFLKRHYISG
tara:strand:- start:3836 stop:4507 length:672 start_codon:yes stop_codon:yes gene_type:complete